jgi:SAM-dependent methyltransferase
VISPYDAFAWFYDRYWATPHREWQSPALEKLLYPALPQNARVLDLCCGTGNLAQHLAARGYEVTGVDASPEMLRIARENAPEPVFLQADAADFTVPHPVDAAVCLFDSLNHLLEPEQLQRAFNSVHAALNPHGCFVFDINTPAAYGEQWNDSACEVQPDHAFFLRGAFDPQTRLGTTWITMFRLVESWQRSDVEIRQRPWESSEIEPMLQSAGFTGVECYRAAEELGMTGHYGIGRVYLRACVSSS